MDMLSQLTLSSWRNFSLFSTEEKKPIDIPSVKIHDLESVEEKPAKRLKYLLKLNHANYAILYNDRKFHNHAPHLISAAFLQGASADDLTRIFDNESQILSEWEDPPAEVADDWRDFLGRREYQKSFVEYFDDEIARDNYDWKQVVAESLFEGEQPVFNGLIADLGHPLIHLAYAYEVSSKEVAMEALGLAATCYNNLHTYLDDPVHSQSEPSYRSTSLFEIIEKVRSDPELDGLFDSFGDNNRETLFQTREALLLNHWNALTIENPIEQIRESQELATALFISTSASEDKYDFYLVHLLTTSHAVRVLLPLIPAKFQIPLFRQWWLLTLSVFIGQLRPQILMNRICDFDLKGRDWQWTARQAVKGDYSTDSHYVKTLHSLKVMSSTWGDHDNFYLKAAVKFAEGFNGWGGFV
ncbi:hypothetical protein N7495_003256 [Penicillium taxi]|uniref:uncharacterized protein n=1 Tax=Penicillium taxi TaxID=168475 RepID=UPI0025453C3E|nr:uncharacterized protein N7495_003256 [Penicillium taxi]KAJ5902728.1 hypothetical protein N7495_003256 [Penicillium taxi]